ncbi:MAG: aminoglycoside phosphotransferase family protein [Patescibacteria group bacterium]
MDELISRIEQLKNQLDFLKNENFSPAPSGTRYKVFISEKYVVRFRDDNPDLLKREAKFLGKLNHSLIPKIVWEGIIDSYPFMIEGRLPGQTLDMVWRNLPPETQSRIIRDIVEFIGYLYNQQNNKIYSVSTGKSYNNFWAYLTDDIEKRVDILKDYSQIKKELKNILVIIQKPEAQTVFKQPKITLVHGDLIIHNLLTDGENITGVLDWESALFGDSDYDLFRLFYYQECAKAYYDQGIDETFESDYMDKLVAAILKSNFIKDEKIFYKKYQLARAIFYLNAFDWAANSDNPEKYFGELATRWNKKRG